jgi:hypothetical protein
MDSQPLRRSGELEAIDFLKRFNELAPGTGSDHHCRGIDGVARRFASVYTGGLDFTMKWNMGGCMTCSSTSSKIQCSANITNN